MVVQDVFDNFRGCLNKGTKFGTGILDSRRSVLRPEKSDSQSGSVRSEVLRNYRKVVCRIQNGNRTVVSGCTSRGVNGTTKVEGDRRDEGGDNLKCLP